MLNLTTIYLLKHNINAISQAIKPLSGFWSASSNNADPPSPLLVSFRKLMALLDSSKTFVDPSFLLISLENSLKKAGRTNFEYNKQQDAVEILDHIIDIFTDYSASARRIISLTSSIEISCDSCYQFYSNVDDCFVLKLPIHKTVQASLNSIFLSESMSGDNAPFCSVCESKQDAESHFAIRQVGDYLIIQFLRFVHSNGVCSKKLDPVICSPFLKVLIKVNDEVSTKRKFALESGICHSGKIDSGHYTAFVWNENCQSWLLFDDSKVTKTSLSALQGPLPYVLFYKAC